MLKRDELAYNKSCLNNARDDEYLFVLLARDPIAAVVVDYWCAMAEGVHEPEKIESAKAIAREMRKQRIQYETERKVKL